LPRSFERIRRGRSRLQTGRGSRGAARIALPTRHARFDNEGAPGRRLHTELQLPDGVDPSRRLLHTHTHTQLPDVVNPGFVNYE